ARDGRCVGRCLGRLGHGTTINAASWGDTGGLVNLDPRMARQRDPFVDFERVRREMDQFLGGMWSRPRPGTGFAPRLDVYYCGDPAKAIVKADLAGISLASINLELSGRTLVISGERAVQETEGRVYQQIDIDTGRFRRVIELSADVDA